MSYDLYLTHPDTGEVYMLDTPHKIPQGTYALGGTQEAHLNITYNYAPNFVEAFGDPNGVRSIYGKTGAEAIPILKTAILKLEVLDLDSVGKLSDAHWDVEGQDYWAPTNSNAKRALKGLLALSRIHPEGIWTGD
jgi:hypothetical protein